MEIKAPPDYWKILTGLRQTGMGEEAKEIAAYVENLKALAARARREGFEAARETIAQGKIIDFGNAGAPLPVQVHGSAFRHATFEDYERAFAALDLSEQSIKAGANEGGSGDGRE